MKPGKSGTNGVKYVTETRNCRRFPGSHETPAFDSTPGMTSAPDPNTAPPARTAPFQVQWAVVALLAGVSVMSGLAFTWPLLRFIDLDATKATTLVVLGWGPWALIAAVIMVIAHLAPLDPDRWRRTLPIHLAACALLALGSNLLSDWIRDRNMPRMGPGDFGPPPSMSPMEDPAQSPPTRSTTTVSSPDPSRSPGFNNANDGTTNDGPPAPPNWSNNRQQPPTPDAKRLASMMLSRSFGSGLVVPVYLLLIAVTQAMRNHRRADETVRLAERASHQLSLARLQALQSQLQPHFLFNTLNAITNYIHTQPDVAEEMLCSLSDMLRRVLKLADRHEIPLLEELELVDLYLAVQRHRFGNRLQLVRHLDESLLTRLVPPLLLQPLVENAIVHGLSHSTSPHPIELRIEEVDEHLRLSVIDHHPLAEATTEPRHHGGVGLANIRHRLETLYGDAARVHAKPRPEGGFLTELNLPLLSEPSTL